MSLRNMSQKPRRRMLVFFPQDKTTSVIERNKVKEVLGENSRLEEGSNVLVQCEKTNYEANVIKLHDDPSVLRQAEREFLAINFASDDESDKENEMPDAPRSKQKTNEQTKTLAISTGQKTKRKQPKKAMCIEGVQKPSKIAKPNTVSSSKSNDAPGVSFLSEADRLKVEKLLSACQNGESKDVGVQTHTGDEICVKKEVKGVQTISQQDHTENVSQRLDRLEQKVESILSLLQRVAATKAEHPESVDETQQKVQEVIVVTSTGNRRSDDGQDTNVCTLLATPVTSVYHTGSDNPMTMALSDTEECSANDSLGMETSNESPILPHSTIALTKGLLEETFKKSSSMANYAKNLSFALFEKEELVDANCAGAYNKKCLETDARMQLIKDVTLKKYGAEDRQKSWSACRKAIDSAIRKIRFKNSV